MDGKNAIRGRLMTKVLKNFHFSFWDPSLSAVKGSYRNSCDVLFLITFVIRHKRYIYYDEVFVCLSVTKNEHFLL